MFAHAGAYLFSSNSPATALILLHSSRQPRHSLYCLYGILYVFFLVGPRASFPISLLLIRLLPASQTFGFLEFRVKLLQILAKLLGGHRPAVTIPFRQRVPDSWITLLGKLQLPFIFPHPRNSRKTPR